MKKFLINNYIIILILILAAFLRFYGINWDQNQHLHPDERFLTMVTQAIEWPSSIPEYFATSTSPLNPHNQNFSFYVYGTFPIFFLKALSDLTKFIDYNQITLLGRFVSGSFDLLTIVLIYLIGKKVFSKKTGLLSVFFYSTLVLPIQLAHFYAVDTFLNFFMVLTTYLLIKSIYSFKYILLILAGVSFGLALSSKISAFLLIPAIFLSFLNFAFHFKSKALILGGVFFLATFLTFRVTQPYAFSGLSFFDITPNPKFISNLNELKNQTQPGNYFPPAVQWHNTTSIVYPLRELLFWGLGIPAGIISLVSFIGFIIEFLKNIYKKRLTYFSDPSSVTKSVLILITLTIFIYQGVQFAKPLRYFYPMIPALIIITSYFLTEKLKKLSIKTRIIYLVLLSFFWAIWPLAFMSIYTKDHSRVQASKWIYQNIPAGSSISAEHWDDALPLNLTGNSNSIYQFVEFPLYAQDTDEKWTLMSEKLRQVDYIVLTSNRLYGGITRAPQMYPITNRYYQALFDSSLGFEKIAEFTSRPNIPIPGISLCINIPFPAYGVITKKIQECSQKGITFIDDYVDETSTVYDHPKVIIFKKI